MKDVRRCELCQWRRMIADMKDYIFCDWHGCRKHKNSRCDEWEEFD